MGLLGGLTTPDTPYHAMLDLVMCQQQHRGYIYTSLRALHPFTQLIPV